jgi:hypothetical protein
MQDNTTTPPNSAEDFKKFVDLLAIYCKADANLQGMASGCQDLLLDTVTELRTDYADWQQQLTGAELEIENLCRAHPEWFGKTRSVKTPYGVVRFHASTKLEIENEEATILLVEKEFPEEDQAARFIRQKKTLNLETLETLEDAQLERLGIKRVADDNFGIKPAKIDLGKAVKALDAKEAA